MKGVSFLYYTQEQIDRANQADLVLFLQSQGNSWNAPDRNTDGNGMTA